jgi:hypothetical protein
MAVMRKYERDIDIMLAEELNVCHGFASWLLSKSKFSPKAGRVVDVFVSKSDNLGESDLIALYVLGDGTRVAILIEDKIDAQLQPDHAGRYRKRAEREIAEGTFSDFDLFLCAPNAYRLGRPDTSAFDHFVPYEDIAEQIERQDSSIRAQYRAIFIREAASRPASNWARVQDDATDSFWTAMYDMATRDFPLLEMKPRSVTKSNSWINFRPQCMKNSTKDIYVEVKAPHGVVALTFAQTDPVKFREKIGSL